MVWSGILGYGCRGVEWLVPLCYASVCLGLAVVDRKGWEWFDKAYYGMAVKARYVLERHCKEGCAMVRQGLAGNNRASIQMEKARLFVLIDTN